MTEFFMPAAAVLRSQGEAGERAFHEQAAQTARRRFGNRVFVRAVVEISNYCRQNCCYCGMRRQNRGLHRFRAHYEQLAEMLIHHRPPSVTDVNIQAGEDPVAVREVALPLIRALRRETQLGISVCLGSLSAASYAELKEAGATLYILKFETADAARYAELEAPASLEERLENIRHLAATGWFVSSGFIAGLPGETDDHLLANFALARELPLDGCSVSPFIPGEETPVSALNLAEPGNGYQRGLRTGANLVTINLTPTEIRGDYLLYKRDRFIMTEERILTAIAAEGLVPSPQSLADFYRNKKINGARVAAAKVPANA